MSGFEDWIGRTSVAEGRVDLWPHVCLSAALDAHSPLEGDEILPLAHWTCFPPAGPQSRIGPDGHSQRGDFLPPSPQPRRMWAGSEIKFLSPIRIGRQARKTARIADISRRVGKSGPLVFVALHNDYEVDGVLALTEIQSLVYRDHPVPGEPAAPARAAPTDAAWSVRHAPDPTLLFRYSAVTFNAHRIHYDEPYATGVEGYPGIVVQGQLTATLMLRACLHANPGSRPAQFSFRAAKPLFSGAPFFVEGAPGAEAGTFQLWARNTSGELCVSAELRTA